MKLAALLPAILRLDIRYSAIFLSCVFSLINIASSAVLNDDAYGYLRAAELFAAEGVRPVLDQYGWYGYSLLMALLDKLLPLDLLSAAHLLNILAYALLVYAFITLVQEYCASRRTALFAALVILLFPLTNEMRAYLIRDFAFWAFCVLALLQLVRYQRQQRLHNALGWCLAMLAATFFRLEGLVLLLLTPLSLLFNPALSLALRLRGYLLLLAILLAGCALAFLLALLAGIDLPDLMAYAYRYYLPRIYNLPELLLNTAEELNQALFTEQNFPGNSGHGVVILILAYLYTVVVNLIKAFSLPLSGLFIYGLLSRSYRLGAHAALPLIFFLGASLLSLLIFILIMHFLTQRYAALACLLLLSLLPLCLDTVYLRAKANGKMLPFYAVFGFFVLYYTVDSLFSFGYSKDYINQAGHWSREQLSMQAELHTNSYAVAYLSRKIPHYDKISEDARVTLQQLEPGEYLAVTVKHDEEDVRALLEQRPRLQLLQRFANERNDAVEIYRLTP